MVVFQKGSGNSIEDALDVYTSHKKPQNPNDHLFNLRIQHKPSVTCNFGNQASNTTWS